MFGRRYFGERYYGPSYFGPKAIVQALLTTILRIISIDAI